MQPPGKTTDAGPAGKADRHNAGVLKERGHHAVPISRSKEEGEPVLGAFAASITGWQAVGERYSAAYGCHQFGQVQRAQGRLDAAVGTYQQAVEITAAPGRPAVPAAGIAFIGMGEVAYQRNELEAAARQVAECIERCRQLTYTQPLATGLAALAWIRQAQGDHAGAPEAMEEAGRVAPGPAVPGLLNPSRRSGRG